MDLGAFVQENKQWLIGIAIGFVCYLIGSAVIGSMFAPDYSGVPRAPVTAGYGPSALAAAETEGEQLAAARQRLERALQFEVADHYASSNDSAHVFAVGNELKRKIVDNAEVRDVEVESGSITWEVEHSVERIERLLVGLDMIDAIQARLFAAHDAVLAEDEDARGLAAIRAIKVENAGRGARRGFARNRGGVDLDELIQEQKVSLTFEADAATVYRFLEACREPGRTLLIENWQETAPTRPGEPCLVKAMLRAVIFQAEEQ